MDSQVRNGEWLEWVSTLLGGASRQQCAATFPPDQFYCLLDELPLHLVPAGTSTAGPSFSPEQRQRLRLNPLARVLPHGAIPEGLASRESLGKFALQGTIAWVQQPVTDSWLPFWLGPRLERTVAAIRREGYAPGWLRDEDIVVLTTAGIVSSEDEAQSERERWQEALSTSAELFQ